MLRIGKRREEYRSTFYDVGRTERSTSSVRRPMPRTLLGDAVDRVRRLHLRLPAVRQQPPTCSLS